MALDPATSPVSGENLVCAPTATRSAGHELRPVLDMTGLPDDDLENLVLATGGSAAAAVVHAHPPDAPLTLGWPGKTVVLCSRAGSSR